MLLEYLVLYWSIQCYNGVFSVILEYFMLLEYLLEYLVLYWSILCYWSIYWSI